MSFARDRRQRLWASKHLLVNALRFFAVLVVILREAGSFFWAVSRCGWPDSNLSGKTAHVLLVADTQYRVGERDNLQSFLFSSYLRRSWHVASLLRPNAVIFLGDMLQDAKESQLSDAEYQTYVEKFQRMFALHTTPPTPMFYLPGNNDVGLGLPSAQAKRARKRYTKNFGPFNQKLSIQNHTFFLLDSPGLVEEDYRRAAKGMTFDQWSHSAGAVEHVKSASSTQEPMILLTHIPLHRAELANCGPLREKGTIHRGVGHGHQNTFGKLTSQFLLSELRPRMIFSADNRDFCEVVHNLETSSHGTQHVRELTIKSFSPARYIQRPGFHLLSVASPDNGAKETIGEQLCLLPKSDNLGWGLWAPLSLIVILLTIRNLRNTRATAHRLTSKPDKSRIPSYDDQDDPTLLRPLPPDGDAWSPSTAFVHAPISPKSTFPSKMRTPSARHKPSNSIAYSPALPQTMGTPRNQSPIHAEHGGVDAEMAVRNEDEDEDEAMYPSQYAHHPPPGRTTSPVDGQPFFLRAPPKQAARSGNTRWSWSWTFVLRGRRRRMTLRIPHMSVQGTSRSLRSLTSGTSKRVVAVRTLIDVCVVLWPAVLVWLVIVAWLF